MRDVSKIHLAYAGTTKKYRIDINDENYLLPITKETTLTMRINNFCTSKWVAGPKYKRKRWTIIGSYS